MFISVLVAVVPWLALLALALLVAFILVALVFVLRAQAPDVQFHIGRRGLTIRKRSEANDDKPGLDPSDNGDP